MFIMKSEEWIPAFSKVKWPIKYTVLHHSFNIMTKERWLTNDASEYRGGGCVWCSQGSVWTTHSGSPVYKIEVNEVLCCKGHKSWVIMPDRLKICQQ